MRSTMPGYARWAASASTVAALVLLALALPSAAAAEIGFAPTTTTLKVNPAQSVVGETVKLSATVEGAGVMPEGEVVFAANYTTGSGAKQSIQIGSVPLVPLSGSPTTAAAAYETSSFATGSYAITASYRCTELACFELEGSVSAPVLLSVSELPIHNTQMSLAAEPGRIVTGQPEQFKVKVWELEGAAVPTGAVTFDDNGVLMGTAQLNAEGVATLTHTGFVTGANEIEASYEGDKVNRSVSATIVLDAPEEAHTVQTTTTVLAAPNPVVAGQPVTITAHVVQAGTPTAPPAGEDVTFTANGVFLGEAPLDAAGNASISRGGWLAGSYDIRASYVGDLTDLSSSGDFALQVQERPEEPAQEPVVPTPPSEPPSEPPVPPTYVPTSVHADVSGPLLAGSQVTLTGTLLRAADGQPVQGEKLTLSLGSQSCLTGSTNAAGKASCAVTASGPLGPTSSRAGFAGDGLLEPSSDSEPALLYALAPGGGSFVAGDRSATQGATVTFWGAQWWKQNSLSGGAAPSAFKGFALTPATPVCGLPWTTGPGNSPPPPAGPLPAYMAVIVTGATTKSGSSISGSIEHVVVVSPSDGYQANPGHAGTGKVLATVC
ncbi:MAG: Ig-like domain-containing protein [Solirubrobacteraceae bacterium]